MVERVEGFCTDSDWRRAFEEINDFEWEMFRTGALLMKFWVDVSQDEQLARFEARKNDRTRRGSSRTRTGAIARSIRSTAWPSTICYA